jgi:hypothetical protein
MFTIEEVRTLAGNGKCAAVRPQHVIGLRFQGITGLPSLKASMGSGQVRKDAR